MTVLQKPNSKSWKIVIHEREFKIAVIKNLNEIKENSERKFNEIENKINEQEYFAKEIETYSGLLYFICSVSY